MFVLQIEPLSEHGCTLFVRWCNYYTCQGLRRYYTCQASGNTTLAKASSDDHGGIANNSFPCADSDNIIGVVLSSEQHFKNNNNSLRILVVRCCGIKTNDGSEIVDFNVDPWKSLKITTYRPILLEWRSEVWWRLKINIATKRGRKLSKKDNPSPS